MDYLLVNQHIAYWGEHFEVPLLTLGDDGLPLPSDCTRIKIAINHFNYCFDHKDEALALALCFINYQRSIDPRLASSSLGDWSENYQPYSDDGRVNPFYYPLVKLGVIDDKAKAWVGLASYA